MPKRLPCSDWSSEGNGTISAEIVLPRKYTEQFRPRLCRLVQRRSCLSDRRFVAVDIADFHAEGAPFDFAYLVGAAYRRFAESFSVESRPQGPRHLPDRLPRIPQKRVEEVGCWWPWE